MTKSESIKQERSSIKPNCRKNFQQQESFSPFKLRWIALLTLFLYTIDSNNCKIPPLRLTRVFVDLSFPSGRPSTWTALLSTRQSQLSSFHRCSKSQNVESLPRSKSLEPTFHQEQQDKSTETKLSLPAGEWDVSLYWPDHRHLHHGNCCKHWSCWHPTGRHLYLCICVFVYLYTDGNCRKIGAIGISHPEFSPWAKFVYLYLSPLSSSTFF